MHNFHSSPPPVQEQTASTAYGRQSLKHNFENCKKMNADLRAVDDQMLKICNFSVDEKETDITYEDDIDSIHKLSSNSESD